MSVQDSDYIWIKETLSPQNALNCARHIANRPPNVLFYYDFSQMQHCPPFGVLTIANAIRTNMKKYPNAEHIPVRMNETQGGNYAHSLGLFRMLGWESGKKELNDYGQPYHIPIVELSPEFLRNEYGKDIVVLGTLIEHAAEKMAITLTQSPSSEITKALQYCIREMVRNTFEHGKTNSVWVYGQFWPKKGRAEIAIMDEGCGIKASLQSNRRFKCTSDEDANKMALQPGVSRMVGLYQNPYDDWQNSGYGLYVSSSLCTLGGHFILSSGTDTTFLSSRGQQNYSSTTNGTIVCLSINAENINDLSKLLKEIVSEGSRRSKEYGKDRILTASKVSTIASITSNLKKNS